MTKKNKHNDENTENVEKNEEQAQNEGEQKVEETDKRPGEDDLPEGTTVDRATGVVHKEQDPDAQKNAATSATGILEHRKGSGPLTVEEQKKVDDHARNTNLVAADADGSLEANAEAGQKSGGHVEPPADEKRDEADPADRAPGNDRGHS